MLNRQTHTHTHTHTHLRICTDVFRLEEKLTILPSIHANPCVLVDAGGGLGQDVDGMAGVLHVVEEVNWDGGHCEHCQPDDRQDVRHYDELEGRRRPSSQEVGECVKMECRSCCLYITN